jgi:hypothetical protein
MGGADGEGESGGAIGVGAGGRECAVEDLAGVGGGDVKGVEVFADFAAGGKGEFAVFEGGTEAGEEFGLEGGGELAEFKPCERGRVLPGIVVVGGQGIKIKIKIRIKRRTG